MTCGILIFTFILLFSIAYHFSQQLIKALLVSYLCMNLWNVFTIEILSPFHLLKAENLLLSWVLLSTACMMYVFRNSILKPSIIPLDLRLREWLVTSPWLGVGVATLLIGSLINALNFPPNTWDSMTYHLGRIPHWIMNQSVEHYATNIYRQLYQPPLAEYWICTLGLLNEGDTLSGLVQWSGGIFAALACYSIGRKLFHFSVYQSTLAVFICISTPELLMQASSTQNDLFLASLLLTSLYFAYECYQNRHLWNHIWLGSSMGLSLLAKGTAYIYLLPIIAGFAFLTLWQVIRNRQYHWIYLGLLSAQLIIAINFAFWKRNYELSSSILGTDKVENQGYRNERLNTSTIYANTLKNVAIHYAIFGLNHPVETISRKMMLALNIDPDNAENNYGALPFKLEPYGIHEDTAANFPTMSLTLLGFILIAVRFKKRKEDFLKHNIPLLIGIVIYYFLFIAGFLKWQPWNTRFQVSLFFFVGIFSAYMLDNLLDRNLGKILLVLIYLYAIILIFINPSRPIVNLRAYADKVDQRFEIPTAKFDQYFINRMRILKDYKGVDQALQKDTSKTIGLMIGGDDYEYPLFSACYQNPNIKAVHLNVNNISHKLEKPISLSSIVASTDTTHIYYLGKRYTKRTEGKTINLYKIIP